MSLFSSSSDWDKKATTNWAISSGGSVSAGAVFFGEAKIFNFHHLDEKKKKSLLLVSAGVGAKLEAKFKVGSLLQALKEFGSDVKQRTDAFGNPLAVETPEQVTVHNPFSLADLQLANAVGVSVGTDAGIVSVGVSGLNFSSRSLLSLFNISGAQIEAILGVGINMGSLQGGKLVDLYPTPRSAKEIEELRDLRRRTPAKYHSRPHPGKI